MHGVAGRWALELRAFDHARGFSATTRACIPVHRVSQRGLSRKLISIGGLPGNGR